MSQVARAALFDWHGEDIAASADERALDLRAKREVFNVVGNRDVACTSSEAVIRDRDRNRSIFLRPRVEYAKLPVELIDYAALAIGTRPSHIPRQVRSDGRRFSGCDV